MSAKFVYRGIPVIENEIVKSVKPVRAVKAPNGVHYKGVLSQDSRGNSFVYKKYPNTGVTPQSKYLALNLETGFLLMNDSTGKMVVIGGDS